MTKAYTGSVKSFNAEKGWGHIECAETFAIYGKDIFLLRSQLGGAVSVAKGAQLAFRIVDSGRGPEATEVRLLPAPGGNGGGAGQLHQQQHQLLAGPPGGIYSSPSYVGIIKSFNVTSGWGHIACAETQQIYGKDIFVMKSQIPGGSIEKGAAVQFCVTQGLKGPEAEHVRPLPGLVAAPQAMHALQAGLGAMPLAAMQLPLHHLPLQVGFGTLPLAVPEPAAAAAWAAAAAAQQQLAGAHGAHHSAFYGTVKSFNEEKGWGHISCAQTQAVYGKDMFVMRSALNGATVKPGDSVQFGVVMGQKGPEAAGVKVIGKAGSEADLDTEVLYNGTIKQYTEEKGWGFIECEATHQLYGKDIFIHKTELGGYIPTQGEAVQFAVQISEQGRPEATRLGLGPGRYAAMRGGACGGLRPSWAATGGKGRAAPF